MSRVRSESPVDLTVVVVTHEAPAWVARCLDALTGEGAPTRPHEVVVVDNASGPDARAALAGWADRVDLVLSPVNLGFGRACNLAVRRSRGRHVVLLNPDAVPLPGSLDALLAFFEADPRRGLVGGRTLAPDGSLDPDSCFGAPTLRSWWLDAVGISTAFRRHRLLDPESLGGWQRDTVREVGLVSGCLMLTSRAVWDALGGFDEDYFLYSEDADLCRRAVRAGYRPAITPAATVVHAAGASSATRTAQQRMMLTGRATYARKQWGGVRGRAGVALLRLGTGVRAAGERWFGLSRGGDPGGWGVLWRERAQWSRGWPPLRPGGPAPDAAAASVPVPTAEPAAEPSSGRGPGPGTRP